MINTPEITAAIASGLVSLAGRMSVRDKSGIMQVAANLSLGLPGPLRSAVALARATTQAVADRSSYRAPLVPGLGDAAAALCESAAQAMRHIAAAVAPNDYPSRLQLSEAASILHNVFVQLGGPLRQFETYTALDEVYGASLSSNAGGGLPLSPLRGSNAFQRLVDAADRSPVSITTNASQSISQLIRSDPVLLPLPVESLVVHLSAIVGGVRVVP